MALSKPLLTRAERDNCPPDSSEVFFARVSALAVHGSVLHNGQSPVPTSHRLDFRPCPELLANKFLSVPSICKRWQEKMHPREACGDPPLPEQLRDAQSTASLWCVPGQGPPRCPPSPWMGCACWHCRAPLGKGKKKKRAVSAVTTVLAAAWRDYNLRVELLCKMHAARRRQNI